ncbi:ORF-82 [Catopsilia pomona nucleopolyhedrovirus]|uniref:ORF-82 n=1 Tax=Catopsilia pomona nucleopolyhedrovirus TaxID=1850906 RepID=A0A172WZF7_9ABAC|nr:ORF-82 [Catopsilia pomona nucleopolyhedrovirus]ANF29730.1 ORF-82 [Catopsilia pomona nucleopolyhedrovirus]
MVRERARVIIMYQLPDMLYQEKMPPRAKRIFVKTFSKYHKLNGGDEDVAMHKARKALEKKYVKMDTINNSWIPRRAAYEIVKDDIHNDNSDTDDYNNYYNNNFFNKSNYTIHKNSNNSVNNGGGKHKNYSDTDDDNSMDGGDNYISSGTEHDTDHENIDCAATTTSNVQRNKRRVLRSKPLGKIKSAPPLKRSKRLKQKNIYADTSGEEDDSENDDNNINDINYI